MKRYIKAAVTSLSDENNYVRETVAADPNTRSSILMQLAEDVYYSHPMVAALTSNLKCPAEVLDRMLEVVGDDTWAIGEILKHPNLSEASLSRVAMSRNRRIREEIFENLDVVPVEILQLLSDDDAPEIRSYVAQASNTPSETLAKMSNDPSSLVKFWVAQNPNTPADVAARLSSTVDKLTSSSMDLPVFNVQEYIAKSPKASPEVLEKLYNNSKNYLTHLWIASNPNTPQSILVEMSTVGSYQTRVAGNPNTPPEILDKLSKGHDSYQRRLVAQNPNTPQATLRRLARSADHDTRAHAMENPNYK